MSYVFHDVDARTEDGRREWLKLRLGIPTASEFHRILSPKKLELSAQRHEYAYRLLEEWITGEEIESYQNEWMQRGSELEDYAISAYEAFRGDTKPGGFFTTLDGMAGGSPDRLVGDAGDLEIKCGAMRTTIGYVFRNHIEDDHMLQIQGRLWIHEREWVDVFAYHPVMPLPPKRVYRDEKVIKAIDTNLKLFVNDLLECRLKLEREFGPFEKHQQAEPGVVVGVLMDGVSMDDIERIFASRKTQ